MLIGWLGKTQHVAEAMTAKFGRRPPLIIGLIKDENKSIKVLFCPETGSVDIFLTQCNNCMRACRSRKGFSKIQNRVSRIQQ